MSIHEEVMTVIKAMANKYSEMGIHLELPPNSSKTFGTEYVEMDLGKTLAARFFFDKRFANPLGMFQGGTIGALFDEVFGPLTYMSAGQPVLTLEMSTTFMRPFVVTDEFIIITGKIVSKTTSVLVLSGEARTKLGKLVATGHNHSVIVRDGNLRKEAES